MINNLLVSATDGAVIQQSAAFWQANFWGILGSITGVAGLIVAWFSFRYNTPHIEIDKMYLVVPDWAARDWKGKSLNELKSSFLDYELEIVVRNKRGGPGSIDKPNLVIGIPYKVFRFINRERHIIIPPETQHEESEKESENVTKLWTVRHGRAFNLGGGERADEKLEYSVDEPKDIFDIVNNFERLNYYAEYQDNNGKHFKKKIVKIHNESDKYKD
jgi:hypothetical protein